MAIILFLKSLLRGFVTFSNSTFRAFHFMRAAAISLSVRRGRPTSQQSVYIECFSSAHNCLLARTHKRRLFEVHKDAISNPLCFAKAAFCFTEITYVNDFRRFETLLFALCSVLTRPLGPCGPSFTAYAYQPLLLSTSCRLITIHCLGIIRFRCSKQFVFIPLLARLNFSQRFAYLSLIVHLLFTVRTLVLCIASLSRRSRPSLAERTFPHDGKLQAAAICGTM